jgi:tetratricopeptide (TPR) repeat protein
VTDPDATGESLHFELERDIDAIGLPPQLIAVSMREERLMGLAPPILILPASLVGAIAQGTLHRELLAVGLRESVAILRSRGRTSLLAESLLALARATSSYDAVEGLTAALEAVAILCDLGRQNRLARAYLDIGDILKQSNDLYDALRAFEIGAALAREHGDWGGLAAAQYDCAVICRRLGLEREAFRLLEAARAALPQGRVTRDWADRILSESVINLVVSDRHGEALKLLDSWLVEPPSSYAPWYYRAEMTRRRVGAANALDDYLQAALEAAAEIRRSVSGRFRRIDRERLDSVFDGALSAAVDAGRADLTLGLLELGNSGAAIAPPIADRDEPGDLAAAALTEIQEQVSLLVGQVQQAMAKGSVDDLSKLHNQAEWLAARADLVTRSVSAVTVTADDVVEWPARLSAALPADSVLLSYFTASGQLHVSAVTRQGVVTRSTQRDAIEASLLGFSCVRECLGRFDMDALQVASHSLLGPVQDIVEDARGVIVLPGASLSGVPFHAMPIGGTPLISKRRVVYATRAEELLTGRETPTSLGSNASWLALASPTAEYAGLGELQGVRDEIARTSRLFTDPEYLVDPPARSTDLLSIQGHRALVHVACHGDFDRASPLFSRLMLSDRPVFAFELMISNLEVDRVILSACDTAAAEAGIGGHVQSLAAAFLRAGAQSVVAALWPVEDDAAANCIDSLYSHIVESRLSVASALSAAQNEVREQLQTSHPYFWAPFAVFGAREVLA